MIRLTIECADFAHMARIASALTSVSAVNGGAAKTYDAPTRKSEIVDIVRCNPGMKYTDIANDSRIGRVKAASLLLELVRSGALIREGVGGPDDPFRYFCPEEL